MFEKNKILIVRLSSMGDIVLTTAFARNIRNHFPDSKIDFILNKQFSDIYNYNPYVDNIIAYDKTFSKSDINQLKSEAGKYDYIFDLQKNRRSYEFTSGLSDNILRIKKNYLHKISLVYLKKGLHKEIKTIHSKYMDTAMSLGIKDDGKGLELWTESDVKSGKYDTKAKKNQIVIAPGAFHYTKRWLPERYKYLAEMITEKTDFEIALTGGKQDKEICSFIAGNNKRIKSYAGETSISETAELVNGSRAIVTNDTGVMHIAAARQVPTIAIFGSTVQEFGFAPFRVVHNVIEKDIKCRPCTHIGRNKCPLGHFKCMKDISAEDVFEHLSKFF